MTRVRRSLWLKLSKRSKNQKSNQRKPRNLIKLNKMILTQMRLRNPTLKFKMILKLPRAVMILARQRPKPNWPRLTMARKSKIILKILSNKPESKLDCYPIMSENNLSKHSIRSNITIFKMILSAFKYAHLLFCSYHFLL